MRVLAPNVPSAQIYNRAMNAPDRLIAHFDRFLRTVAAPGAVSDRRSLTQPQAGVG